MAEGNGIMDGVGGSDELKGAVTGKVNPEVQLSEANLTLLIGLSTKIGGKSGLVPEVGAFGTFST